ncbi:type VI secretion system baseplate subunit TssK [Pyxidicoccus fallax]|uniref:Type VI secretion system baseplate subunit TssK n=1 Tax=Pyxidicoccus fallax TaxID=394095 RepID=A0A848LLF1_9BACT|nr:type VI secretion system baseplate subunit TssK [Pyxidicoccus fallax]NMO18635.1 type VI secretion system baseplate subunit TssK [Pyxidicoccus fallax]NPC79040.1 type VI secretion system baseplate subunit TssK [Pyxidicoccus fallax]
MESHKIARVRWQAGQMLLPEHFRAQDEGLSAEALLTAELTGVPMSGIGALELNRAQLAEGIFALGALTAIMPGGHLVQVPGNATVAPVSLEETGRSRLTLYLHLMQETRGAEGIPLYAKDAPALHRALHVLQLSMEQALDGALSSLALAELSKDEQGRWELSREQLPPLLRASPHPFLEGLFTRLDELLDQARGQLRTAIRDNYVRGDRLSNARRALCEVRRVQGLRADMRHGLHPPTYHLFEALRRLYLEMCCYLECEPEEELPAYQHDAPGPGLWRWMTLLERGLRPSTHQRSYRPFECREGRFILSRLPQEEPAPNDFYLLVRRHERDKPRALDGVKLASPLRLSVVKRLALKGLTFRHVPYPSFPHAFDSDIDWYQLTTEGEEWQAVLREDGVAFPATPALEGAQIFLFWRRT